jgi:DNA polymerase-3 subunit epsilon
MHGALIDADLLSRVYLTMTGGQKILLLEEEFLSSDKEAFLKSKEKISKLNLLIKKPSSDELKLHEEFLNKMSEQGICVWRNEK